MTSIGSTKNSIIFEDEDYDFSSISSQNSNDESLNSEFSFVKTQGNAILFDTSIPMNIFKKHHIKLYSSDESFTTIFKEDLLLKTSDLIFQLKNKFKRFANKDLIIKLVQNKDNLNNYVLQNNDYIIKLQNSMFRDIWVHENDLPNAILNYSHDFKFYICEV
ncbi:hypothetical protein WICMUC_000555 [Wickerhamomyces mucosus]|uniref:Uncharacterized protein n=1 Tax=Wickerhamomyces mucosus TaxID=1378264 RepID=A0A9P8PYU1_9ASCO|nr:hypothetical protein WICMUC_000555 [Wickerhamomyces mucosus]